MKNNNRIFIDDSICPYWKSNDDFFFSKCELNGLRCDATQGRSYKYLNCEYYKQSKFIDIRNLKKTSPIPEGIIIKEDPEL